MRDLTKAIISLYPTAFWELHGDEYSGLVWKSDDIEKPSEEVLFAECDRLKEQAEIDAQAKINTRQSALNKLMALGLTEEEALALGVK
jgi:hypothetical protein